MTKLEILRAKIEKKIESGASKKEILKLSREMDKEVLKYYKKDSKKD